MIWYNDKELGDLIVSEKELVSSVNEYEKKYKSSKYVKQLQWDMAFGLQKAVEFYQKTYL